MNIEDYQPSEPVEDRRGETYYGRQRRWPLHLVDRRQPRSLLDLLYSGNDVRSGLARDAGYNMIGQDPRMGWRNRLPLPDVQMQNYPANVQIPYEPAVVGLDQPWTTRR
jgi:hypothetical protein